MFIFYKMENVLYVPLPTLSNFFTIFLCLNENVIILYGKNDYVFNMIIYIFVSFLNCTHGWINNRLSICS